MILQDFENEGIGFFRSIFLLIFSRGYSAVFFYRLSRWCYLYKLKPLAIVFKFINDTVNSCDISYRADIGRGFKIYHSVGVVIGEATIGSPFYAYQNITIGENLKTDSIGRRRPIIGNNVTLYSGCIVAGPVIIGNNVNVGANAVVFKDVPENSTVIGYKSEIINNKDI